MQMQQPTTGIRLTDRSLDLWTPAADNDAALLDGLGQGDAGTLERLIREHGSRMLEAARRLTRDEHDARHALALAWSDAVKDAAAFDGAVPLSTWLRRLAIRAALRTIALRQRPQSPAIEDLLPAFDGAGAWPPAHVVDEPLPAAGLAAASACIDLLPDDYRIVFVLRDVEALSDADTAELLGVTPAIVRMKLHHARMALVTLLRRHRTTARVRSVC